jgi:3-dehydroquinate dehydratase-2
MSRKKILILNGPNLNLLGTREPEVYGSQRFEDFFEQLVKQFPDVDLHYYQSNIEGEIINKLHQAGFSFDLIVLNAGGYTHTSVAIADAVGAIKTPVIEVHITNPMSREEYRHKSLISAKARGVISGLGLNGYRLALISADL